MNVRLEAAPDVVSRVVDGEAVLLHLGQGEYFGLNEVGSFIWELVVDGTTVGDMVERVVEHFDVERQTAERDIAELVQQLLERKLIEPSAPSGP